MSQWFKKNNLVACLLSLFFIQGAYASSVFKNLAASPLPKVLTAEEAFGVSVTQDGPLVKVSWQVAPNCYLYRESIKVNLITADNEAVPLLNETNLPAGKATHDPYFGDQVIYENTLTVTADLSPFIRADQSHSLNIQIDYQGCAESGFCYPPISKSFVANIVNNHIKDILPVSDGVEQPPVSEAATAPEIAPDNTSTVPPKKNHSFIVTLLLAYLAGVGLSFTPCVLPMIPILLTVIVGQGLSTRRAFSLSLCYVLSMSITYAMAGIIVTLMGQNLQAAMQKPLVLILFSSLFVYLGLVQLGIGKVSLPAKWRDWLHHSHSKQTSGSYVGAAVMGVLATLIASPCVSAPMIGTLSLISQSGNILLGGSALFAMGLGIGTLLLVLGTLEGKFLPKKGPWMHAVNQTFAIILFGISIWLMDRLLPGSTILALWGILLLLAAYWMGTFSLLPNRSGRVGALLTVYALLLFMGSWYGSDSPLTPLGCNPWQVNSDVPNPLARFESIDSLPGLEAQQALAKKRERPLMVLFHANWCTACKHFEHNVLANQMIQKKLSDWETVLADVTKNDTANQLLLKKFDLVGPPVVLFFDKNGNELTKFRLVGETSRKKFSQLLEDIQKEMQG